HGFHDLRDRLGQGLPGLRTRHAYSAGKPAYQIPSPHFDALLFFHRIGRADGDLDLFRCAFTGEEVVGAPAVLDEGLIHLIAADPVAERPRGDNLSGGPSDHAFGFLAHRDDLAIVRPLGDHGRLAQDDALALDVDQRVGRPQINPQVATEPVK